MLEETAGHRHSHCAHPVGGGPGPSKQEGLGRGLSKVLSCLQLRWNAPFMKPKTIPNGRERSEQHRTSRSRNFCSGRLCHLGWQPHGIGLEVRHLSRCTPRWGLKVNPKKTAYYASPYVTEKGPLIVDNVPVESGSSLEIMGIALQVPLKPSSLLDSGLAKARRKYFACRQILECRGP